MILRASLRHPVLSAALLLGIGSGVALAQHGGGGGHPGGGAGGMGGGGNCPGAPFPNVPNARGGIGFPDRTRESTPPPAPSGTEANSTVSTMRGGLQLGPPGRWWDDKKFARSLGLRSDQQTRMDEIFNQNKNALVSRYSSLRDAESQMEKLSRASTPDEAALFAQIDRVAQARAELEKANTHMLLQLRAELTPQQLGSLDDHRPARQ